MHTPEPVKAAMRRRARAQPDALRAVLGDPGAAPGDPGEGPRAQRHPGRRREPDRRQRRHAGPLRGVRHAARPGRRGPACSRRTGRRSWTWSRTTRRRPSSSRPPRRAARASAAALAQPVTPKTKVLYWNSPNNPTGDVFSRAEVEEVAAFARERGLAVISDEAYEDLVYEGEPTSRSRRCPGWASGPSPSSRSRRAIR